MIPKIELEEAGDLVADGNEDPSQNKERETQGETDDVEEKCDNNNTDIKMTENETETTKEVKEVALDGEAAAMGAATAAAAAAGVAAAASTNGNSAAKSSLKYNPFGEKEEFKDLRYILDLDGFLLGFLENVCIIDNEPFSSFQARTCSLRREKWSARILLGWPGK